LVKTVQSSKSKVQSLLILNLTLTLRRWIDDKGKEIEELKSWQKGRELTNQIYRISSAGSFAKDFGLRDQMRRAGISILSNIAEGFERGGDKEFLQFLAIAKGSAGELRSQLYIAMDQGYVSSNQFEELAGSVTEISKLLAGMMKYLKESSLRGNKLR
jgi:four helix bundle protein